MREILFRGKRTDNHQWVEGFYIVDDMDNPNPYIVNARGKYRVAHKSVGQYTGLKDKNGKLIFEGDIVRDLEGTVYPVVWGGTGFYLKYDPPHAHGYHYDLLPLCNYWHAHGAIIEIIGNVHDNPELLEGESDATD